MEQVLGWDDVHALMDDVRATARRLLRREAHAQSLHTMALVLTGLRRQRLAHQDWDEVTWHGREHFLAAMYRAMERALKDHGRYRSAQKRKARESLPVDEMSEAELLRIADFQPQDIQRALDEHPAAIDALVEALAKLERTHPDWAAVARHRYYAGLTVDEIARLMGIAERTVRRHWEKARILLYEDVVRVLNG